MNVLKTIEHIKKYIKSTGFDFPAGTVENLYLSLKSKPFLILCGPEGCGKYTLVKLFCESIDITGQNGRFKVVTPGGSLEKEFSHIGFINNEGEFCPGEVFEFIISAANNPQMPYILYIDSINMTDPDIYLREIIKAMDTALQTSGSKLISEPVIAEGFFKNTTEKETFGTIGYPDNLYIVAGVTSDEKYAPISVRLKDRANFMEICTGNTEHNSEENAFDICTKETTDNSFLKSEYFGRINPEKTDVTKKFEAILAGINKSLKFAGKELGYRVQSEISAYLNLNRKYGLLTDDEAIDNCILQRILPRLEGSDQCLKGILSLLFRQCVPKGVGDYYANSLKMFRALTYPDCRYIKSAGKITVMTRRFEESGYCIFR